MIAMTVQQPYAWAIAAGYKPVENRSKCVWPIGEPIALHAGARWSRRGAYADNVVRSWISWHLSEDETDADLDKLTAHGVLVGLNRHAPAFHTKAVLAVVTIAEVHADAGCCRPWGESLYTENRGRIRTDVVHLSLVDVHHLGVPVPCPGQLGPWALPSDVETAVRDQLKEAHRG